MTYKMNSLENPIFSAVESDTVNQFIMKKHLVLLSRKLKYTILLSKHKNITLLQQAIEGGSWKVTTHYTNQTNFAHALALILTTRLLPVTSSMNLSHNKSFSSVVLCLNPKVLNIVYNRYINHKKFIVSIVTQRDIWKI